MSIKSVKVTMSSVGVNSVDKPRRVKYMPIANITYNEKDMQKKSVLLDNCMVKKDYFKGWIIGVSFFAGITKDSYQIYDEEGNRTGTAMIEEVGRIIQVNQDDFICLKGKYASLVNTKGEVIGGRELTNEELKSFA